MPNPDRLLPPIPTAAPPWSSFTAKRDRPYTVAMASGEEKRRHPRKRPIGGSVYLHAWSGKEPGGKPVEMAILDLSAEGARIGGTLPHSSLKVGDVVDGQVRVSEPVPISFGFVGKLVWVRKTDGGSCEAGIEFCRQILTPKNLEPPKDQNDSSWWMLWDPDARQRTTPNPDFLALHPDLKEVVARWPKLPAEVRRSILAIVGAFPKQGR